MTVEVDCHTLPRNQNVGNYLGQINSLAPSEILTGEQRTLDKHSKKRKEDIEKSEKGEKEICYPTGND